MIAENASVQEIPNLRISPTVFEGAFCEIPDALEITFGAVPVAGTPREHAFADRAMIPRAAWRVPSDALKELLLTPRRGARPRCGAFVLDRCIVDDLSHLIEKFPPPRMQAEGIPHDVFEDAVTRLDQCFGAGEPSMVGAAWDTPGRDVLTVDNVGKFIGLHLDRWDGVTLAERSRSRTRICMNLGPDVRSFLYVPIRLQDAVAAIGAAPGDDGEVKFRDLIPRFFSVFPTFPIVRINLPPGTGYFADTDNLIHDGSSALATVPSLNFTIRGRYSLI